MNRTTFLAIGIAGLSLSGCGHYELVSHTMSARDWGNPAVYEAAKTTAPSGSAYTAALAREYLALAANQKDEGDLRNYERFSRKALLSAQGVATDPELPERWDLELANWSERKVVVSYAEAYQQRTRLMNAFWKCTRNRAPEAAAKAQASYDWWIEELEEGWEVNDINAAKASFLTAVEQVEKSCPPNWPQTNVIYFNTASSSVGSHGKAVVRRVATQVKTSSAPTVVKLIHAVGHADTRANPAYNQALSERRAAAVKAALVAAGVPAESISVEGQGEYNLPHQTGDGVANQQNRSVDIHLWYEGIPFSPATPE